MTLDDDAIADLIAYADGRLDSEDRRRVEARLAADPEAARFARDVAAQNDALRAALAPVLAEPIPSALLGRAPPARRPLLAAAAAVLAVTLGFGGGWLARDLAAGGPLDRVEARAALAWRVHAAAERPALDVAGDDAGRVAAWLEANAGVAVKPPRLGDLGFALAGARLMMGETGPAALLVYAGETGERLALYVQPGDAAEAAPIRLGEEAGVGVATWTEGRALVGLSGPLAPETLSAAAALAHAQMRDL